MLKGNWLLKGVTPVQNVALTVRNVSGGKHAGQYIGHVMVQDADRTATLEDLNFRAPYVPGHEPAALIYWTLARQYPELQSDEQVSPMPLALTQALKREEDAAEERRLARESALSSNPTVPPVSE